MEYRQACVGVAMHPHSRLDEVAPVGLGRNLQPLDGEFAQVFHRARYAGVVRFLSQFVRYVPHFRGREIGGNADRVSAWYVKKTQLKQTVRTSSIDTARASMELQ